MEKEYLGVSAPFSFTVLYKTKYSTKSIAEYFYILSLHIDR